MATKKNQKFDLPGTQYQRNKRWWWKAQLPGDEAPRARAMKPLGAKFATTDYSVARDRMIQLDWSRKMINQRVGRRRIRRHFDHRVRTCRSRKSRL